MKSIAVLFFAMCLVIAFVISSGVPHLNEIQVIHPEKHAVSSEQAGAGSTYIIGVHADGGTIRVLKIWAHADAAVFGLHEEKVSRS